MGDRETLVDGDWVNRRYHIAFCSRFAVRNALPGRYNPHHVAHRATATASRGVSTETPYNYLTQLGGRFSLNAAMPSRASDDVRACI